MDRKHLEHYAATQAAPVFTRPLPTPTIKPRPLWPLLVYAALLGFAVAGCAGTLLNIIH